MLGVYQEPALSRVLMALNSGYLGLEGSQGYYLASETRKAS